MLARDITKRKKAKEKLKASEEKYRNIVELAPDSIMTFDLKWVVTSCNSASTNLSGYSKDELIGKRFTKIAPIRARDVPKFLKMFTSTIMGNVPKPFEVIFEHKNGTTLKGEVHISLIKEEGKPIAIQAIMRDISDRSKAEEEIKNLAKFPSENPNPVLRIAKEGTILYSKSCTKSNQ